MRKLSLRKEVLAELTSDELSQVVGGEAPGSVGGFCPTDPCITRPVTGIWCLTDTIAG